MIQPLSGSSCYSHGDENGTLPCTFSLSLAVSVQPTAAHTPAKGHPMGGRGRGELVKERGRSRGGKVVSQLPCNKDYCILANLWPHLLHKNLLRCKDHQVGHSPHMRLGDYVVHIWSLVLLWVYTPTKGRGREGEGRGWKNGNM